MERSSTTQASKTILVKSNLPSIYLFYYAVFKKHYIHSKEINSVNRNKIKNTESDSGQGPTVIM